MGDRPVAAQGTPDAAAAATKATADAAAAAAAAAAATAKDGQPASGDKAGAPASAPKVPDHYELSIPKGGETVVDAADLEKMAAAAKTNGWTNEEAQEILNENVAAVNEQLARFLAETEADPTYGGKQLEESQRLTAQVIDKIRPKGHPRAESFRRMLKKTGVGNHIELFSFLADLGKLMREDNPPASAGASRDTKRAPEQVLYGDGAKSS